MSDNTTAIRRLLDESNKLWDAMYVRGEVPTYGERYYFFRAMADAMYEDAKLRELVDGLTWCAERECGSGCPLYDRTESDHCRERRLKRELGIEVDA